MKLLCITPMPAVGITPTTAVRHRPCGLQPQLSGIAPRGTVSTSVAQRAPPARALSAACGARRGSVSLMRARLQASGRSWSRPRPVAAPWPVPAASSEQDLDTRHPLAVERRTLRRPLAHARTRARPPAGGGCVPTRPSRQSFTSMSMPMIGKRYDALVRVVANGMMPWSGSSTSVTSSGSRVCEQPRSPGVARAVVAHRVARADRPEDRRLLSVVRLGDEVHLRAPATAPTSSTSG